MMKILKSLKTLDIGGHDMNWFLVAIIMVGYTPTINVKPIAFDSHQQCMEYMGTHGEKIVDELLTIYPTYNNINVGCVDQPTLKFIFNDDVNRINT